jgi:ATP/maltotriose-dependent transcriptional regulator MalT
MGVLWSTYSLSRVALGLGQTGRARQLAEAAAQLARQIHSVSWVKKTDELLQQLGPGRRHVSNDGAQLYDEPLSQRELEVLHLLKSELTGPDIAKKLIVSLNTVRYHTKNIYRKLGAGTRLEAIQRAKELGL